MPRLSLQYKILSISVLSLIFMFAVMSIMHFRDVSILDKEAAKSLRNSNKIALDGVILMQKLQTDKLLTKMLNIDEVLQFAADPANSEAAIIVKGQYPSLDADGCKRFTIYDENYTVLYQEHAQNLRERPETVSPALQAVFRETSKDFVPRFYFRHNEAHNMSCPVEYAGVTVLTDENDAITGYLELNLDVMAWITDLARLTGFTVSLYDIDLQKASLSSNPDFFEMLLQEIPQESRKDGKIITKVAENYYLTDIMPVHGPDNELLQLIFLSQDYTEQQSAINRNKYMSIGSILSLTILSMTALFFFLKKAVIKPVFMISSSLEEEGGQISTLSAQVADSGQNIADGASEQAAAIEEASASLEETASMARQNADNASQANMLVASSLDIINKGNNSMHKLSEAMQGIASASEATLKIVKTIDAIAFQTNLLALNAAVEAARAGEAGAGFAVVADEVRNLAMRAAEAAKETNELIEGTSQRIKEGSELVLSTSGVFEQIVASSDKVSALINDINSASNDQARGVDQLSIAVSNMEQITQQNAAGAEESASVAREMSSHAHQIKEHIQLLGTLISGSPKVDS